MDTIVVGYDGAEPSERALARAAELAEALGARIVVVSVAELVPAGTSEVAVDPFLAPLPPLVVEPSLVPEGREAAQANLERARAALSARSVEAEYRTPFGDPADELVAAADEAGADLIVVGTREPGFLDRLLGGSVSQRVARSAHCDVLIVH